MLPFLEHAPDDVGGPISTRAPKRLVLWRVSIACAWLHRRHNRFSGLLALQTLLGFLDGAFGTATHLKRYRPFSCFRRCREPEKGCHQIARVAFKDRTVSRNDL